MLSATTIGIYVPRSPIAPDISIVVSLRPNCLRQSRIFDAKNKVLCNDP